MTGFLTDQIVFFIDDDADLRAANVQSLELANLNVKTWPDAPSALPHINRDFTGVIVSDIRMPGMDGLELFARLREIDPEIPVILMTGHADVPTAIAALKDGAFDFLAKPFATDHLIASVRKALETRRLVLDNRMLRAINDDSDSPLIGDSATMVHLREKIEQLARVDVDILIEGETGTGKELVALLLHRKGPRRAQPLIAVNCGALPEALAEVELFGHDRGAVGHGPLSRDGYIVQADRGTLFLDEIDSMPLALQANLLRILEERTVWPIGSTQPRGVNIRVIAAAKANLEEEVRKGNFREDLYYRLNVVRLRVPPLRERRDDIPALFSIFVDEAAAKLGINDFALQDAAHKHLIDHDWPGNVRELRNFAFAQILGAEVKPILNAAPSQSLPERVAAFEGQLLRETLMATQGNIAEALTQLGIPRKTLYDKMARHGIEPKAFRG